MVISPKLYVSDNLAKKKNRITKRILDNRRVLRLYVITGANHKDNLFEIYEYNQLFQKVFRTYYDFTVYGIAKTKEDAIYLIEKMTQDCLDQQGDCNLKQFMEIP